MRVCEQFLSGSNKCNDDDVGIRNSERGNRVALYTRLSENTENLIGSFSVKQKQSCLRFCIVVLTLYYLQSWKM